MTPLVVCEADLDIERIQEAIRARIRARALGAVPADAASLEELLAERTTPLGDWNFPSEIWRAMWPPELVAWNLDEDYPIRSHRSGLGPVLIFCKRITRRLVSWIARPLLVRQAEINRTLALMTQTLARELSEQRLHQHALEGRIARLGAAAREARGEEPPLVVVEELAP